MRRLTRPINDRSLMHQQCVSDSGALAAGSSQEIDRVGFACYLDGEPIGSLAERYLAIVLGQKSEIIFCEADADIFHCASLETKSLGHHPQIIMQFSVALFDMVSNFAAFKGCCRWVGNPPPSHRLPVLQLMYFTA
jgi:hypothetical protein